MKKRLRKKLHRGEFIVYGFQVDAELISERLPEDKATDKLIDLIDVLYDAGVEVGGGVGKETGLHMFATGLDKIRRKRIKTATEATKRAAARVLNGCDFVKSYTLGPLVDAFK